MALETIKWLPSPNFDDRDKTVPIDMLVFHYTGMKTGAAAIERLCDPAVKVSAHYVVEEDGRIFSLIREDKRAWHAGLSFWRGARDINARSIGIEIVNPGHEFGYRPFPKVQIESVKSLAANVIARHAIPARNIVGHSDVAPARKEDPGEFFNWRDLAEGGIGLWPGDIAQMPVSYDTLAGGAEGMAVRALQDALQEIGYEILPDGRFGKALTQVVRAFQRHWRPERVDGIADPETQARIYAVLSEVRRLT